MENLTETQKEAISSLVNLTEEFCNRELSQKAERLKGLFPEAFADPKEQIFKVTVSGGMGDGQMRRMLSESFNFAKFKVVEITDKELPEIYTAEEVVKFTNRCIFDGRETKVTIADLYDWEDSKSTKSDERKEPFYALGVEFPNSNDDFGFELKRKPTIAK